VEEDHQQLIRVVMVDANVVIFPYLHGVFSCAAPASEEHCAIAGDHVERRTQPRPVCALDAAAVASKGRILVPVGDANTLDQFCVRKPALYR
jgi:hypothetical protein